MIYLSGTQVLLSSIKKTEALYLNFSSTLKTYDLLILRYFVVV